MDKIQVDLRTLVHTLTSSLKLWQWLDLRISSPFIVFVRFNGFSFELMFGIEIH